jgi:hypothetical protein
METLRVIEDSGSVVLIHNGLRVMALGWKASVDALGLLRGHIRNLAARQTGKTELVLPETGIGRGEGSLTFRQEQGAILVIGNGRLLFSMPLDVAGKVYAQWLWIARGIEELEKADQIAQDAAILHRGGSPIGLTNNPKIQEEAAKLALGDRDLRRFMRDQRKGPVLGAPTIQHTQTSKVDLAISLMRQLG